MAEMGWCPSGRLFEAAACGAPVLTDAWDGLDAFFAPGREILIARGTEEAVAALELGDDELARIAARRAASACWPSTPRRTARASSMPCWRRDRAAAPAGRRRHRNRRRH